MIKLVQVTVGPELAGEIADRQPARPVNGKQVVAWKPDHLVLLAEHPVPTGKNLVDQPQNIFILNFARKLPAQNGVVDTGEKLADIALQHVAETATVLLAAIKGAMRALYRRDWHKSRRQRCDQRWVR